MLPSVVVPKLSEGRGFTADLICEPVRTAFPTSARREEKRVKVDFVLPTLVVVTAGDHRYLIVSEGINQSVP